MEKLRTRKTLFAIELLVVIVLSALEIKQMVIKADPDPDLLFIILILGGALSIFTKIANFEKRMGYFLCYFGGMAGIFFAYHAVFAFLRHFVGHGIVYAVLSLIFMLVLNFMGKDLLKFK